MTAMHPMDRQLAARQWRRARLRDLQGESAKVPLRLVCMSIGLSLTSPPDLAAIDVRAWTIGNLVRIELEQPDYPPFLEQFVIAGLMGASPLAVGLTPCHHSPQHWNSLCMPLIWQQAMNEMRRFHVLVRQYAGLLRNPWWQCPDTLTHTS